MTINELIVQLIVNVKDKVQYAIGTTIFDGSLPSELLDQSAPKPPTLSSSTVSSRSSPHTHTQNHYSLDGLLHSFLITGRCIFKQIPRYNQFDTISISLHTYTTKFPYQSGQGWRSLWQSIKGYSKREIYISEGFMYILERKGVIGYYVWKVWVLDDVFKVFFDGQTNDVRMVFYKEGSEGNKVESRDFWVEEREEFFRRLRDEFKKIGRQM